MNWKRSILFFTATVALMLGFNNCGRFKTTDQWNGNLLNQSQQSSTTDDSMNEVPSPQFPTPTPTPTLNPIPVMNNGPWPNEPVGLKTVLDCPFDNSICDMWNGYNTQAFANFSNAPYSPSGVFDSFMGVGLMHGNGQWGYNLPNAKEVYLGFWWSTNAEFEGYSNNQNKMVFLRNAEIDNNFLVWQGAPDQPKTLKWYMQATYDNCGHAGESGMCYSKGDGTGWFEPNTGVSATVTAGSGWHRIEIYMKTSTTKSSRDGVLRWYLDGKMVGNYPTVNMTPLGVNDFQINHAWDNSGVCGGPGVRDCRRSWHHYFDHVKLSIR